MKGKVKRKLRVVCLCLIVMFLLIPLFSSPVAAIITPPISLGRVWTNNWPPAGLGPTAGGATTIIMSPVGDTPPYNIQFSVDYTYTDSYPNGMGSYHSLSVFGSYLPGGSGGWIPFTFTQSTITLGPSGSTSGTYTTPWIISYGGGLTKFSINITATCQDISTMTAYTWTSSPINFYI